MATIDPADREFTNHELREMSDAEAEQTLTKQQWDRREKLLDLHGEAAETREEWATEAETVAGVTVEADIEDLGTELDLYGNDVIVRVDETVAEDMADPLERLGEEFEDISTADPDDAEAEIEALDADATADLVAILTDLYDAMLRRWNGHDWQTLPQSDREAILDTAAEQWGASAMFLGLFRAIMEATEDREEVMGRIKSFLDETGTRDHRTPR